MDCCGHVHHEPPCAMDIRYMEFKIRSPSEFSKVKIVKNNANAATILTAISHIQSLTNVPLLKK
jgi:hypothetical protein